MIYYTCNLKFKNIQHVTWLYLNPGQGVENFLCDLPINYIMVIQGVSKKTEQI
jgi:hypothetical protein